MIQHIQRYTVFIKISFFEQFQYRIDFLLSLVMSSMVVVLNYYLWKAVFAGQTMIAGITPQQMITYVIISGTIQGAIIYNVINDYGILVEKGDIVLEIQRPVSLPLAFYSKGIGTFSVYIISKALPILIVGALITHLKWPTSPFTIGYFCVALLLSFTIYFLLSFALAQVLNYLETYWALLCLSNFIIAVFTGQLIPFSFFPQGLKTALFYLPFHTIFYTPISIFLEGQLDTSALHTFLVSNGVNFQGAFLIEQMLWIAVLVPLVRMIWAGTSKHIMIQGA